MCGRYTFRHAEDLRRFIEELTGEAMDPPPARYNVAPAQENPVVRRGAADARPRLQAMRWGLVPPWDRSEKPRFAPINARAEEMLGKPAFRAAVQQRRCVVPADGYFEWQRPDERTKIPHYITRKDERPFFMAGIYEAATGTRPPTYALLTCAPNALLTRIHDRMPVILPPAAVAQWLTPGPLKPAEAAAICVPFDPAAMQAWPVSSVVNNARHDVPECVVPVLTVPGQSR